MDMGGFGVVPDDGHFHFFVSFGLHFFVSGHGKRIRSGWVEHIVLTYDGIAQ